MTYKPRRILALSLATSLVLSVTTGCISLTRTASHGYQDDENVLAEIEVGKHGKRQVFGLLGSPSTVSTFEDNTWYYIHQKSERFAFFGKEITDQYVVAIDFEKDGRVGEIRRFGLKDGKVIEFAERETETHGHEITILQQLLGNLGRFNPNE